MIGSGQATVHNSNFEDNVDYSVRNDTAGEVNAEGNWWGDPDGPLGPYGGPTYGNVDYTPWATGPVWSGEAGPSITSAPNLSATVNQPYAYDADHRASAVGTGNISWTVAEGPIGFQIDAVTGEVIWLPAEPDQWEVILRATDDIGSTTQRYQVVASLAGDGTPPNVTDFSHVILADHGSTWDAKLSAVFSENVVISQLDVAVLDGLGQIVPFDAFAYRLSTYTLDVEVFGLNASETYTFRLMDTITDMSLNPLDGDGDGSPGGDSEFTFTEGLLIPGDANGDGCVDDLDLTALAVHWQQSTNLWEDGDFNGDGIVDDLDLTALAVNWQQGCGGGGSFADALATNGVIPEPATLSLFALAGVGLLRRRS